MGHDHYYCTCAVNLIT